MSFFLLMIIVVILSRSPFALQSCIDSIDNRDQFQMFLLFRCDGFLLVFSSEFLDLRLSAFQMCQLETSSPRTMTRDEWGSLFRSFHFHRSLQPSPLNPRIALRCVPCPGETGIAVWQLQFSSVRRRERAVWCSLRTSSSNCAVAEKRRSLSNATSDCSPFRIH